MKSGPQYKLMMAHEAIKRGEPVWVIVRGDPNSHSITALRWELGHSVVMDLRGGLVMVISPEDLMSVRYDPSRKPFESGLCVT